MCEEGGHFLTHIASDHIQLHVCGCVCVSVWVCHLHTERERERGEVDKSFTITFISC
jgi:hypothetical protein